MADTPLGTNVATQAKVLEDLCGQFVSLNMSISKYYMPPSGTEELLLTAARPTIRIPERGHISRDDLVNIAKHIKAKHLVLGSKPVPEHERISHILEKHLGIINGNFPFAVVEDAVFKIVNGPSLSGGYTKIEILDSMYEAEELNPVTQRGGKNRAEVLAHLREAIKAVLAREGGVSKVKVYPENFQQKMESSLRKPELVNLNQEQAKRFLGVEPGEDQ